MCLAVTALYHACDGLLGLSLLVRLDELNELNDLQLSDLLGLVQYYDFPYPVS